MDTYSLIYKKLSKLDFKYENRVDVNPNVFILDIVKQVNKLALPAKIAAKRYTSMCMRGVTDGMISGLYIADLDDMNKPSVFLCFSIPFNRRVYFKNWGLTKSLICSILEHEFVHVRQHREREFDEDAIIYVDTDELDYLSHEDEIEAYGLQCARELLESCFTAKNALSVLNDQKMHISKYSHILKMYTESFRKYPRVQKVFYRWVKVYIEKIEKGTL